MSAAAIGNGSSHSRVLIVEDEGLIAHDIASRLEHAGYEVAGIAESGVETLRKIVDSSPDLILMDIRIKGDMDGIETAARVQEQFDLPVIYLTAHSDRETLARARVTGPFGYLTKPLQQANLQTSIEIALHKHRIDREVRQQRAWLNTVLQIMGEAVIVTDGQQRVQFLNSRAEQLTGWKANQAIDRKLLDVLEIFDQNLSRLGENVFAGLLLEDGPTPLPPGLTAMDRSGHAFVLEGEAAACVEGDDTFGSVITFRDATARRKQEQLVRHENKMQAIGRVASGVAQDFNQILASIRGEAEHALRQEALDAPTRASLEAVLRSTDAGQTLTQQMVMFGYVWAA